MTINEAEHATWLAKEIKNLSRYKEFISENKHSNAMHFSLYKHWVDCPSEYNVIHIPSKYTERFLPILEKIIVELTNELTAM